MGSNNQNYSDAGVKEEHHIKRNIQNKAVTTIITVLIVILLGVIGVTAYNITKSKQETDKKDKERIENNASTNEMEDKENKDTKNEEYELKEWETETVINYDYEDYNQLAEPSDNRGTDLETYVSDYVRPMYNQINNNLKNYTKETVENATVWRSDKGIIKKIIPKGSDGYNMERQYYYDPDKGEVIFAFIFDGKKENRLYFMNNDLVRYIGPSGKVINNPESTEALNMADRAVYEAYKN